LAPSWQGAQMEFLGSLYTAAMGLQMQQSMLPPRRLPLQLSPPPPPPPPPLGSATAIWC
jgi:hypothetical protein